MGETRLEVADDRAELAGGEEPWPEGTGWILPDRWKGSQSGANLCRHVLVLPANLVFDGLWPVRVREADGLGRIGGGTKCMGAHMAHGYGLTGGSGRGRCGGSLYITSTDATDKPTADLLRGV